MWLLATDFLVDFVRRLAALDQVFDHTPLDLVVLDDRVESRRCDCYRIVHALIWIRQRAIHNRSADRGRLCWIWRQRPSLSARRHQRHVIKHQCNFRGSHFELLSIHPNAWSMDSRC